MLRLFLLASALGSQEPVQVSGEDLKAGLVGVYRSSGGETLRHIDPKPAFALGESSPHPRLAPGPFEVTWTGVLLQPENDVLTFSALVGGEVEIDVGGVDVLKSGTRAWKPGAYRIRIHFRSRAGVPARLQIWWEGKGFAREPIPPWRFRHVDAELDGPTREDELAAKGRSAAFRWGCARCHASALPGARGHEPGPSLADAGLRMSRAFLVGWLEDPSKHKPEARMPALFSADRKGFVERWIIAEYLIRATGPAAPAAAAGDHRMGRRHYVNYGCFACHGMPDDEEAPRNNLADRLPQPQLTAFLLNPHARYPDGRMPALPMPPEAARDVAAFLLLWSKPAMTGDPEAPKREEIDDAGRRLGARGTEATARALLREKRCGQCHAGLGETLPADVPLRKPEGGCLGGSGPRFALEAESKKALAAYLKVAAMENHPSPFDDRQGLLRHFGCFKCHARDSEKPPPIEEIGSTLGGAWLQRVPFQRTPRLTYAHAKYRSDYLVSTVRDGAAGSRGGDYTYRMPAYGHDAPLLVQALAEGDGDLTDAPDPSGAAADPTLANVGPSLVGFEGYSCVSCHVWKGGRLNEPDPGAIGPELTTATRRLRREFFDRWVEDPARYHPGTPMPQIFKHGQGATLRNVLEGDAAKQRDALWAYLSKGREAPSPKPLPPLAVGAPADGPLVAQVPVILPDKTTAESITILFPSHDLVLYDVGTGRVQGVYTGARLLRQVRGRLRTYTLVGAPVAGGAARSVAGGFQGYDRLPDGARIRAAGGSLEIRLNGRKLRLGDLELELPPAQPPPPHDQPVLTDSLKPEGSMERPGYRAIAYPRPKAPSGEDLLMPSAIAAHPRDGRVYVASMKVGEIFALDDPKDNGEGARWTDYAGGLFQEAYSMLAESDGLYVLHRRNLTKVIDTDGDGKADRFDRAAGLPHSVTEAYDYGYGLARDKGGAFVMTYAPYGIRSLPGAGSMIRLTPGDPPKVEEVAFGFRNPLGWCAGPEGEIFYTDNQGEWVATNKLCHIVPGRYYGFPNPEQAEHTKKPPAKTTVWVPYGWAHSINGVTYDATGGKFGPFAGQFFMAELMFGGAIIRAAVEKVNGEYQGSCFPFWGKGLLGPLVLTFDPKGRMWVGSITEPGWMAQPDRGAVYRIDFTGEAPFEMKEIRALPRGFRIVFTRGADAKSASDPASYLVESWRYEYTGAYGSPELDRARVTVEKADPSADGLSADLTFPSLVKDRVYLITLRGVKSARGELSTQPLGAYTLNEIPDGRR